MNERVKIYQTGWDTSLARTLYQYQSRQVLCDAVIKTKDGPDINAHSVVLAISSPVLCNIFTQLEHSTMDVTFPNITSETWTQLLQYMYLGSASLTAKELFMLGRAAAELEMRELMERCSKGLNEHGVLEEMLAIKEEQERLEEHAAAEESAMAMDDDEGMFDFTKKEGLNVKIDQVTGKKRYICELCGKSLCTKQALKNHKYVHSDARPFICDTCGKNFKTERDLNNHRDSHNETTPFGCQVCGKAFKSKKLLRAHNAVHQASRNHTCPECDATFKSRTLLNQHTLIHGDARFSCHICSKSFMRKQSLEEHLLRHDGKRPYKCPVCSLGFYAKFRVDQHMKVVHDNYKRFTCQICNQKYNHKKSFEKHLQAHDEQFISLTLPPGHMEEGTQLFIKEEPGMHQPTEVSQVRIQGITDESGNEFPETVVYVEMPVDDTYQYQQVAAEAAANAGFEGGATIILQQ